MLTTGGYTFTFQNGDVTKITSKIVTNIEVTSISGFGPLGGYIYDYEGVTKQIAISGRLTVASSTRVSGYSVTAILTQKQWLESVANGIQGAIEFDSNYESQSVLSSSSPTAPFLGSFSTTYCKIASLEFNEEEANPDMLPFTMVLEVGL